VRMTCFIVLALSMFGAGALCLMAVWDATPIDVAWKSIVSLGIVAALMAGFTLLNEVFGPKKGDTTA
jgi:multidrug transporter EmrE-like cation transporter